MAQMVKTKLITSQKFSRDAAIPNRTLLSVVIRGQGTSPTVQNLERLGHAPSEAWATVVTVYDLTSDSNNWIGSYWQLSNCDLTAGYRGTTIFPQDICDALNIASVKLSFLASDLSFPETGALRNISRWVDARSSGSVIMLDKEDKVVNEVNK